jgi:hypothetical protein
VAALELRIVRKHCGEDMINRRFVERDDARLCCACADGAYYVMDGIPFDLLVPAHDTRFSLYSIPALIPCPILYRTLVF